MPFLPPNQQRQSTEGKALLITAKNQYYNTTEAITENMIYNNY